MKKLLRVLSACALAAVLALSLFACGAETQEGDKKVTVKLVQGEKTESFDVDTNVLYFSDVFVQLVNEKKVTAEYEYGKYGLYVTSINGTAMSGTQYWALYSDVADEKVSALVSTSEYDKPYTLDGTVYYSAITGASGMPCRDGATYLWVLTSY